MQTAAERAFFFFGRALITPGLEDLSRNPSTPSARKRLTHLRTVTKLRARPFEMQTTRNMSVLYEATRGECGSTAQ
jgi:hypothetical protein